MIKNTGMILYIAKRINYNMVPGWRSHGNTRVVADVFEITPNHNIYLSKTLHIEVINMFVNLYIKNHYI